MYIFEYNDKIQMLRLLTKIFWGKLFLWLNLANKRCVFGTSSPFDWKKPTGQYLIKPD